MYPGGTRHLKLQTIFEDNRNGLIEEHRHGCENQIDVKATEFFFYLGLEFD